MCTNDIMPTLNSIEERMVVLRKKTLHTFDNIAEKAMIIRDDARELMGMIENNTEEELDLLVQQIEGLEQRATELENRYKDEKEKSRFERGK